MSVETAMSWKELRKIPAHAEAKRMAHELTKGGKRRLTIDEFKELLDDDRVSQYGKINVRSAVSAIMDICPEDDNVWWVDARSIKCERARMIQKITFKID